MWRDEIYIFFTARDNSLWKLITQQHWDTAHPPLHSIFLHFWQMISTNPFWLRLPSLIASFFILYLVPVLAYKISKRYKLFPFIFLYIFSVSLTQISLNIVARPYPFVILLIIISLTFFFTILEEEINNIKLLIKFAFVNWLLVFLDYSAIWLFAVYLVFFLIYYIFKIGHERLRYVFNGLLLSALCSLTVLPFLFGNFEQSMKLEENILPVYDSQRNFPQGKNLYIQIQRSQKRVTLFDEKFKVISTKVLPRDPFPMGKAYLGYNIAPYSLLYVKDFSICAARYERHITEMVDQCKFENFTGIPLRDNTKRYPLSKKVVDIPQVNNHIFINTGRKWNDRVYDNYIDVSNSKNVIFRVNFYSTYIFSPPGINIYGAFTNDLINWWNGISRFTISPTEGQYSAEYYGGGSPNSIRLLNPFLPLSRFSGEIQFFSGFPDYYEHEYLLMALFLLIIGNAFNIFYYLYSRNKKILFIILLFWVPILLSLLISYYYSPIFLGRNLHLSNIAYLCGISLLCSVLASIENKKGGLLTKTLGFIVLIFLSILSFAKFPYLYYVDPPFPVKSVIDTVIKSPTKNKLIILGNNEYYVPLLKYELEYSTNSKVIVIGTLDSLRKDGIIKKIIPFKAQIDIYFVQFGNSLKVSSNNLEGMAKMFDCDLKEKSLPFTYFAQCK